MLYSIKQVAHAVVPSLVVDFVIRIMPDKLYLKYLFKKNLGYKLDFNHPETFNAKLNWMKIYYRKPLFTKLADKYEVKRFVADKIGGQYVVQNLGCWNTFDEIDFNKLPDSFVLKCTHDSSGAIICKDKSSFNMELARERIENSLNHNFFYSNREWPYKDISPRIIADVYLDEHNGRELNDYKFWCFNGEPKYMYCTVKNNDIFENFYDMNFNPVDINHGFRRRVPEFDKPAAFELMKELASKLSEGIPFVRVDFFYVEGHVYFGEYTFYDWAGLQAFSTFEQDKMLGDLILLDKKNS